MLLSLSAIRAVDRRRLRNEGGVIILLLLALAALSFCVALFVAFSRVHDNYHFPADVVTGASLGYAVGALTMRVSLPLPLNSALAADERSSTPLLRQGAVDAAPAIVECMRQ